MEDSVYRLLAQQCAMNCTFLQATPAGHVQPFQSELLLWDCVLSLAFGLSTLLWNRQTMEKIT